MSNFKDETGNRYANLTVMDYIPGTDKRSSGGERTRGVWRCKCDCGEISYVTSDNLKRIRRGCLSCGFEATREALFHNIKGQRFAALLVLEPYDRKSHTRWKCLCDCGEEYIALGIHMRSGRTTSCLSCARKKGFSKRERYAAGEIPKTYWDTINKGAKKRELEIEISAEYAYTTLVNQNFKCALTGEEIGFRVESSRKHTASLDRIDSTKGYIVGNVQWVHKEVNWLKKNRSDDDFILWCKKVAAHADSRS